MIPARFVQPLQEPPGGDASGGAGLGSYLSDPVASMTATAFDAAMQKVWDAGLRLLRGGLTLADHVAPVDASSVTGNAANDPAPTSDATGIGTGVVDTASLWPSMIWLAAVIALGLFFYQLISVAVRGGRGMFRAFTGPAQFGIAIAVTTGAVATLLTAADGLTTMFLSSLSEQGDFASIIDNPVVADRLGSDPDLGDVEDEVRSMLLGLAAFFGTIPAGIGFALLMIFRQAAILVLIATIPIAAAGLVADSTASIFWRSARWVLAAILLKPVLGLVLLVGVNVMVRAEGVAGLLAGTAVLLVSLSCPIAIFRLLAFVDPGTAAGAAVRSRRESWGFSEPGSDNSTSEAINIARYTEQTHQLGTARRVDPTDGAARELGGTTAGRAPTGPAGSGAAGDTTGDTTGGAAAECAGTASVAGRAGAVRGAVAVVATGFRTATKAATRTDARRGYARTTGTDVGDPGPAHVPRPAPGAGPPGDADQPRPEET